MTENKPSLTVRDIYLVYYPKLKHPYLVFVICTSLNFLPREYVSQTSGEGWLETLLHFFYYKSNSYSDLLHRNEYVLYCSSVLANIFQVYLFLLSSGVFTSNNKLDIRHCRDFFILIFRYIYFNFLLFVLKFSYFLFIIIYN